MTTASEFVDLYGPEIGKTLPIEAGRKILDSLLANYYSARPAILSEEVMHRDVLANLMRRQSAFERFLTPWVNIRRRLSDATVLDIGCGTGSSTAAFARVAKRVKGFEIAPGPVAVASDRLKALGLDNAQVERVHPNETIDRIKREFPDGVDVIALIAVLEHMTVAERADFLPKIWNYMRPGDILVVAELPNRLTYNDDHTAQIPFFHMLPVPLKVGYANRSPRKGFVDSVEALAKQGRDELELGLARWGIGLSYHDFELGLGTDNLESILLADGYEHATLNWWPPSVEERVLIEYFMDKPVMKPLGFCRSVLNFIFVKPPHQGAQAVTLRHNIDHLRKTFDGKNLPEKALQRMLQYAAN